MTIHHHTFTTLLHANTIRERTTRYVALLSQNYTKLQRAIPYLYRTAHYRTTHYIHRTTLYRALQLRDIVLLYHTFTEPHLTARHRTQLLRYDTPLCTALYHTGQNRDNTQRDVTVLDMNLTKHPDTVLYRYIILPYFTGHNNPDTLPYKTEQYKHITTPHLTKPERDLAL